MRERVKSNIEKYKLIEEFDKVVIGVSGGHDSMALLYVLKSLKSEFKFEIIIAHINHGVRGIEADDDEEYVKKVAKSLDIPFYSFKANMDEYARIHKLTSEEAGREIRYEFFESVLKKEEATKIAVAHNKDDQAETLIMRFMRGTGIDGLRGMEFKTRDIIRPILNINRSEIEKYCVEQEINPRIDKTNLMPIYGRNKVRLELIPFIENTFNSGIINTLFRTSEIMKTDSDFFSVYTEEKFKDSIKESRKLRLVLDIEKVKSLHTAIKTRVIRRSIEEINFNLKGIERKHIKDIVELIDANKTGKKINIINNIIVKISYDDLIFEIKEKTKDISFDYKLDIDETLDICEIGSELKAKLYLKKDINIDFNNKLVKCFDYDNIKSELHVRNRRNGDRFIPLGMNGNKKLKDFFIDEKISKEEREKIPLVLDGDEIIWVVGYRISEKYKVSSSTKNVLVLEYIK